MGTKFPIIDQFYSIGSESEESELKFCVEFGPSYEVKPSSTTLEISWIKIFDLFNKHGTSKRTIIPYTPPVEAGGPDKYYHHRHKVQAQMMIVKDELWMALQTCFVTNGGPYSSTLYLQDERELDFIELIETYFKY